MPEHLKECMKLNFAEGKYSENEAAVIPGYHQNKEHWNTVILDGSVPVNEIKRMIAESYDLVTAKERKSR